MPLASRLVWLQRSQFYPLVVLVLHQAVVVDAAFVGAAAVPVFAVFAVFAVVRYGGSVVVVLVVVALIGAAAAAAGQAYRSYHFGPSISGRWSSQKCGVVVIDLLARVSVAG